MSHNAIRHFLLVIDVAESQPLFLSIGDSCLINLVLIKVPGKIIYIVSSRKTVEASLLDNHAQLFPKGKICQGTVYQITSSAVEHHIAEK